MAKGQELETVKDCVYIDSTFTDTWSELEVNKIGQQKHQLNVIRRSNAFK